MENTPMWQQKASELFPDLCEEMEEPDSIIDSIYQLFFELLPRCEEATKANNTDELRKIYDFAEWCSNQEEKDLWNAAGVAFYEHLVDEPETRAQIPQWLSPEVFDNVSGLFEWRMSKEDFTALQAEFDNYHHITRAPPLQNSQSVPDPDVLPENGTWQT